MALQSRQRFCERIVNRRAKDGETILWSSVSAYSRGLVGMGRVVASRTAQRNALAFAVGIGRYAAGPRAAHRYQLAAGGRFAGRLPGLLLLHLQHRSQERRPGDVVVAVARPAIAT